MYGGRSGPFAFHQLRASRRRRVGRSRVRVRVNRDRGRRQHLRHRGQRRYGQQRNGHGQQRGLHGAAEPWAVTAPARAQAAAPWARVGRWAPAAAPMAPVALLALGLAPPTPAAWRAVARAAQVPPAAPLSNFSVSRPGGPSGSPGFRFLPQATGSLLRPACAAGDPSPPASPPPFLDRHVGTGIHPPAALRRSPMGGIASHLPDLRLMVRRITLMPGTKIEDLSHYPASTCSRNGTLPPPSNQLRKITSSGEGIPKGSPYISSFGTSK